MGLLRGGGGGEGEKDKYPTAVVRQVPTERIIRTFEAKEKSKTT